MNNTTTKRKKNKSLQLAVHLTTALVASCVVAGIAFSYGIAATKPPIIQVNKGDEEAQEALIKSGEVTGRLDATRQYNRGLDVVYIENRLSPSEKSAFLKGYDRGYKAKQADLAKAGLLYGSCLRANGIAEDQVLTQVKQHLEVKVFENDSNRASYKVKQGVFADAVGRSYHLGYSAQRSNDAIFLKNGSSECSLRTTYLEISKLDHSLQPVKFDQTKDAYRLEDGDIQSEVAALVATTIDNRLR